MTAQNANEQLIDYAVINLQSVENIANFFVQENTEVYANSIGRHIRHIIEHYEALVLKKSAQINYDSRGRDELLEKHPSEAIQRIENLIKRLRQNTIFETQDLIKVSCAGGSYGDDLFVNQSSVGRELCFLNSHCVHHLAIIKPICKQFKIPLNEYFGYAASTIAYLESQKMEA